MKKQHQFTFSGRLIVIVCGVALLWLGIYLMIQFFGDEPGFEGLTLKETQWVLNEPCAEKSRQASGGTINLQTLWFAKMSCLPEYRNDMLEKAEQGDSTAQFIVYVSYMSGFGFQQDKELGLFWMIETAKSGDAIARYNVRTTCQRSSTSKAYVQDLCSKAPADLFVK